MVYGLTGRYSSGGGGEVLTLVTRLQLFFLKWIGGGGVGGRRCGGEGGGWRG